MIEFLLIVALYSLGAYQAKQIIELAADELDEDEDTNLVKWYFILLWPYITAKDIYLDLKESK